MLDWQFVPEPGVFDWRTPIRDRIDAWAPAAADAAGALLWGRIATSVRAAVTRADPLSPAMARTLASALWQVALFCEQRGLGEGERVWTDPRTLAAFVRHGRPDLAGTTRAQLASRVRSLADPVPCSGRDVFTPYTPAELAALWAAAGSQPGEQRSLDARILIALGAGAGLTAAEIAQVRAHDVRPAGAAVVVAVRGRTQRRMVIVRRAFEHTLAEAAHAHTGQVAYLLAPGCFSRQTTVSKVTGSLTLPEKCPRPLTRRLRASWLKELAESGIALPVLAAAAGITDLSALTRLLRHLHRPDDQQAADQLREG
jgi:integrase